ncbi:MAG: transposase, partial [Clostridium perfringens]|nr:transposase [Clostridium perfringens]MDU3775455.1 transposase [Clostridium perfringens]
MIILLRINILLFLVLYQLESKIFYINKNIKEGRATRQNIQKQVVKIQRLYQRLANIRTDYINKTVFSIIKQKPSYITIEDLAVSNLM